MMHAPEQHSFAWQRTHERIYRGVATVLFLVLILVKNGFTGTELKSYKPKVHNNPARDSKNLKVGIVKNNFFKFFNHRYPWKNVDLVH